MKKSIFQAFQQAPWRVQLQKFGLALVVLAGFALIAGIYLSITAKAYSAGVAVQVSQMDIENIKQNIEDLKTLNASLSSSTTMEKRSKDMGFEKADPGTFLYIVVPGYLGRQLNIMKAQPPIPEQTILIKPEYKRSLWEWMFQGALALSENPGGLSK